MYVWEMIACRLRGEGWSVWHASSQAADGWTYLVHFHRPGIAGRASGPTLTEAYAEAARQAHSSRATIGELDHPEPHYRLPAMAL